MLKAVLFILIGVLLLEWSGNNTALFGADHGRRKQTAHPFSLESLPVYYEFSGDNPPPVKETSFSDFSISPIYPEDFQVTEPEVYYQAYDDTALPAYGNFTPVDENFGGYFIDGQNSWGDDYYSCPESEISPDSPYFSDYFSVDDSNPCYGAESDDEDRLTYQSFSPDVNPISKELQLGWRDVQHLYTWNNVGNYAIALGLMAIVANTSMDQKFADWYQNNVRCTVSNDIAWTFKDYGEGEFMYPIFIGGALIGDMLNYALPEDSLWNQSPVGEYFSRTARAEVIAVPVLLLGQAALGATRPCYGEGSSHWSHPFTDGYVNGISGHSYVGSIPFITLAQMSEPYWCKGLFYAMSVLPGFSRINDDSHYLSQVILGWYLGYLSCRSVTETETGPLSRGLTIFPLVTEESTQIGLSYDY